MNLGTGTLGPARRKRVPPTAKAAAPARTSRRRAAAVAPVLPDVVAVRPDPLALDALPAPSPPTFPALTFDIRDHGATADVDATDAIARAIAACAQAGGGRVLVPAGAWLSGPIRLRDKVELHLAADARLRFVDDPARYLPAVPFLHAGHLCLSFAPMIYATGATKIAVTGAGTIVGTGERWWAWAAGEPALAAATHRDGTRRFDDPAAGGYRPPLVGFFDCRDVLIEGLTIDGAGPACAVRLARCERATVRGLRIRATDGPDTRGIVAEACRDVRIVGCDVEAACCAVTVAGDAEGRVAERATVSDVRARSLRSDAVCVGPNDVRDARISSLHVAGARHAVSLRGARGRGGLIERIDVAGVTVDRVSGSAVFVSAEPAAFAGIDGVGAPQFRQVHVRRVTCAQAGHAVTFAGVPEHCVEDVTLHDLDVRAEEGLTCASVVRLWIRDVRVTPTFGPDLALRDARDVWIDGIRHDRPAATFLDLRGRRTARVHLASARDANVRPAIVLGVDVPRDALVQD